MAQSSGRHSCKNEAHGFGCGGLIIDRVLRMTCHHAAWGGDRSWPPRAPQNTQNTFMASSSALALIRAPLISILVQPQSYYEKEGRWRG